MQKFIFLLVSFIVIQLSAAQEAKPYFSHTALNLVDILPPPPVDDSAQTKAELAEVLSIQNSRSAQQTLSAQEDSAENIWRFSNAVNDSKFAEKNLPKFSHFFERVDKTEAEITDAAKEIWKRPRPFLMNDQIKPVVKLSKSGSYPSGHATIGTMMGIILAQMIPEKRSEIMKRAAEFADNRLIAGMHFRSDIEAGKISGTAIVAVLMTDKNFKKDFLAAKKELRSGLSISAP